MAKVIFLIFLYKIFGKMQKGIIVYETKFKRRLHPFFFRFVKKKILMKIEESGIRKYQTTQKHKQKQPLTCEWASVIWKV